MTTLIDLTMEIDEKMPRNFAHGRFPLFITGTQTHTELAKRKVPNAYDPEDYVTTHNEAVLLSTHTGTHIDAPFHADERSEITVDRLPLDAGFGSAVCLDVTRVCGARATVQVADLEAANARNESSIRPGDIVLIHTGWDSIAPDKASWYEDHMGLSREAAEWLRRKGAKTVGIDSCSVDTAGAADLPAHMNFLRPTSLGLEQDDYINIIETLTRLHQLPRTRFTFVGVPLPLVGATGSPIRAFALIDD